MVHNAHEVLNNNFKVFMTKKIKSLKGALGVEPRTYRSAVDCSTTELYPRRYERESKFNYINLDL